MVRTMATRDPALRTTKALAHVDETTARVNQLRAELLTAEDESRKAVVKAAQAGIAEGRPGIRSEVQRRAPFSPPVVRRFLDDAGIPPDERYVRKPKP